MIVTAYGVAKIVIEVAIAVGGPALVARALRSGQTLVLNYHDVLPDSDTPVGDRSLHLARADFVRQLDALSRTHEIVPVEALLSPATKRTSRPRAVITFDDAYHGALTVAVEELEARRLPATVFVAPALLGGRAFWWDMLADPRSGEVPPDVRRHALNALGGQQEPILSKFVDGDGLGTASAARSATEAELQAAASVPGITVASHSWSHPNLTKLDDTTLEQELTLPRRWLEDRFTNTLPFIAYPYGLFDERVRGYAAAAGYEAAFSTRTAWVKRNPVDRLTLPRLSVAAGLSHFGFVSRAAGAVTGRTPSVC